MCQRLQPYVCQVGTVLARPCTAAIEIVRSLLPDVNELPPWVKNPRALSPVTHACTHFLPYLVSTDGGTLLSNLLPTSYFLRTSYELSTSYYIDRLRAAPRRTDRRAGHAG